MFAAESHTSRHHIAIAAMACLCALLGGPSYAAPAVGVQAWGVYLLDAGAGGGPTGCVLSVDASWLDAAGTDGGIACAGGSLVSARFVTPAGGAFGAGGAVDASGAMAPHVVIEPEGATAPAGESDSPAGEVPGGGVEPSPDVDPAIGGAATEQATHPMVKPAVATKTTNTKAVTKTTVAKASNPKSATATSSQLPKTADSHWIAVSPVLFLLGIALFSASHQC